MTTSAATVEFLTTVSDAVVDLGAHGIELHRLTIHPRHAVTFREGADSVHPAVSLDPAVVFPLAQQPQNGTFRDHEHRRTTHWEPAASAPAYVHLAWLLIEVANEFSQWQDAGITLIGIERPDRDVVDAVVSYRSDPSGPLRLRIRLANRAEPMEFPAMCLREVLSEGRYQRCVVVDTSVEETLVDLRESV